MATIITKDKLLAEIKNLEAQEARLLADANAARGAIMGYKYLISEIDKAEEEQFKGE